MKIPIVDLDFQKTLVYTNNIRKANNIKPLEIIHPRSQEEFIGLFDTWSEDDNIIIDVGGFDSNLNRMALYISDFVITPAVDRVTEIAGLSKFHQIVTELSKKMKVNIKTNVLLNDVNPVAKDFSIMEELVDSYDHFELMNSIVSHRADFYKTMEEGKGVSELKDGKAKKEIKKLIKEILKKGKQNGKTKD